MTATNENIYARNAEGVVRQIESIEDILKGETQVDKIIADDDGSSIYAETKGMNTIHRYKKLNNDSPEEARSMRFKNIDDAEELYEFGANHSNVEWAFAESKKDPSGRSISFVGNNEGGHSWLLSDFEAILGDNAFHTSHSHISVIEGASVEDMKNAKARSSARRTIYDVTSGYLEYDQFTLNNFRNGRPRYKDKLGHNRPRQ